MSLLLLLRPKYPVGNGGLPRAKNNKPWLSFPKNEEPPRRNDDDEVVILIAL